MMPLVAGTLAATRNPVAPVRTPTPNFDGGGEEGSGDTDTDAEHAHDASHSARVLGMSFILRRGGIATDALGITTYR